MLRRCLLSAAALLLLLTPRAEAAPIILFLTVDYGGPTDGNPNPVGANFMFFESASGNWQTFPQPPTTQLALIGASLLPGETQLNVSLDVDSLDNVYFKSVWSLPNLDQLPDIMMAMPPDGPNVDGEANLYGQPWIPLANLGSGLSGDYHLIVGDSGGRTGTWALSAQADVAPVPEPASMLLLGSGLAAVLARKYRQSKAGRPLD